MSRLRTAGRIALITALALVVCGAAWIVGGNAIASRREHAVELEWIATFGSYQALVRKYTVPESNASARRVEEIARDIGVDLTPRQGRSYQAALPFAEEDRAALRDYVEGELTQSSGVLRPAPPHVAVLLSSHHAALLTFEEFLCSAPPPRWVFDASGSPDDWPRTMVGAHLHLQRMFVAQALDSSSNGEEARAARALEASWVLSQGLAARPEMVSQVIATAVSRLDVGVLRRIGGSTRIWTTRLEEMGSRRRLVDTLVLEQGDVRESRARLRRLIAKERSPWAAAVAPFQEVRERLWNAEYSQGWMRAIVGLRDAPAFEAPKDVVPESGRAMEIVLAIPIPNLRNAIDRLDRLAVDAELTGKILRIREERKVRGAWPDPSPEIASSRFPGLSWNYHVDGDAMTISLSRELPSPYPKNSPVIPLPLSFSSSPSRP